MRWPAASKNSVGRWETSSLVHAKALRNGGAEYSHRAAVMSPYRVTVASGPRNGTGNGLSGETCDVAILRETTSEP
jgi:hypothetical protein